MTMEKVFKYMEEAKELVKKEGVFFAPRETADWTVEEERNKLPQQKRRTLKCKLRHFASSCMTVDGEERKFV